VDPEEIDNLIRAKIEAYKREKEEIYRTIAVSLTEDGRVVYKGRALSLKEIKEMIEAIELKKRTLEFILERRQTEYERTYPHE